MKPLFVPVRRPFLPGQVDSHRLTRTALPTTRIASCQRQRIPEKPARKGHDVGSPARHKEGTQPTAKSHSEDVGSRTLNRCNRGGAPHRSGCFNVAAEKTGTRNVGQMTFRGLQVRPAACCGWYDLQAAPLQKPGEKKTRVWPRSRPPCRDSFPPSPFLHRWPRSRTASACHTTAVTGTCVGMACVRVGSLKDHHLLHVSRNRLLPDDGRPYPPAPVREKGRRTCVSTTK